MVVEAVSEATIINQLFLITNIVLQFKKGKSGIEKRALKENFSSEVK